MSTPPLPFDDLLSAVASPAPVRFPVRSPTAAVAPAASSPAGKKRGPKKRAADQPKRKRGPKPKAAADLRTHCVSVWMNPAELKALDKRRAHLPPDAPDDALTPEALAGKPARGEWLRFAEAGAMPPAPPPAINVEAWIKLATALGNLNQIARALNSDAASVEINAALAEVRALRNALIGTDLIRSVPKPKKAKKSPEPGGV